MSDQPSEATAGPADPEPAPPGEIVAVLSAHATATVTHPDGTQETDDGR